MIRCANCSHEHTVASDTCSHCGQALPAEHEAELEAPAFDTPTVHAKVEAESGTISFEHAYGTMNTESASSFMSILEKHAPAAPKQGLIDAALARNTDTPAPAINSGPVTLPQSHIEQIRNKLKQAAAIQNAEPMPRSAVTETIDTAPLGLVASNRIPHDNPAIGDANDAGENLTPTVAIRPQMVVVRGERLDVAYPILKGKNFIGRMADQPVDIDLESQEPVERIWTSRQHAVVTYENGALVLEDLASLNGTFVNRTRLYPGHAKMLQPGDIVQIGTVQMRLTIE